MEVSKALILSIPRLVYLVLNFHFKNIISRLVNVDVLIRPINLLPLLLPILLSSCSINKAPAVGDDLVANELCGTMVDSGGDPCEHLREINLRSAIRSEEYNDVTKKSAKEIDKILEQWEIENSQKFLDKKINIYHKSRRSPFDKDYGLDGVINVYFWLVEIKDKKMLDVIFLSRSKHSHIVTSRQCDLNGNLNDCLNKAVRGLIENNISAQIFNSYQHGYMKIMEN